jgi:hypothetical protein
MPNLGTAVAGIGLESSNLGVDLIFVALIGDSLSFNLHPIGLVEIGGNV